MLFIIPDGEGEIAEFITQELNMEKETVNNNPPAEVKPEARTFTQEEVDKMIGARIYEERAKFADYAEVKAKAEKLDLLGEETKKAKEEAASLKGQLASLQKEIDTRNAREKVSAETGVPARLLTGETEEACKEQAEAILNWKGPRQNYPSAHDAGEVNGFSGGKTRDQFADWFNSEINK